MAMLNNQRVNDDQLYLHDQNLGEIPTSTASTSCGPWTPPWRPTLCLHEAPARRSPRCCRSASLPGFEFTDRLWLMVNLFNQLINSNQSINTHTYIYIYICIYIYNVINACVYVFGRKQHQNSSNFPHGNPWTCWQQISQPPSPPQDQSEHIPERISAHLDLTVPWWH